MESHPTQPESDTVMAAASARVAVIFFIIASFFIILDKPEAEKVKPVSDNKC